MRKKQSFCRIASLSLKLETSMPQRLRMEKRHCLLQERVAKKLAVCDNLIANSFKDKTFSKLFFYLL